MTALDLYDLKRERGGMVYDGGRRWIGPGPGHSRRDASLSVRIEGERVLVHSFANDPFVDCAAYLGLQRNDAAKPDRAALERMRRGREAEVRLRRNTAWRLCERIWSEAQEVEDTPAETYLTGRGLRWPYPPALRFHAAAPLDYDCRRRAPALVALVRSVNGSPQGLHLTALAPDGRSKASPTRSRVMFGSCRGNAVQLVRPELGEMAVAEGLETALSFVRLKGVPTWAALSTAGLRAFELPPGVTLLHIAMDGDEAGRDAARELAERASKVCDVLTVDPGDGLDWNDVLQRGDHG